MTAVIQVENLSKRYRIGRKQERQDTLVGALTASIRQPFRNLRHLQRLTNFRGEEEGEDILWALKDVSFEVKEGDVVGVIGRNGAGKSTLLKILAQITYPTQGRVVLNGRVASLLEVGTGFHPELTGRDNIFLNGTILGMTKMEIDKKFDEIVTFAEVEKFIDTPVKHYSSGMRVRLAFAVAAHLEPEILLVDEVLAVGDAAFQKKCLGKMEEVAQGGRTVLFVSHNMGVIQELCERGILLEQGKVVHQGETNVCIRKYFEIMEDASNLSHQRGDDFSIGTAQITGCESSQVVSGKPFKVQIPIQGINARNPNLFFILEDSLGRMAIHHRVTSREIGVEIIDGVYLLEITAPPLWLTPGAYFAYFKIILSSISMNGRFLSEKVLFNVNSPESVDIIGTTGRSKTTAFLSPSIEWQLRKTE